MSLFSFGQSKNKQRVWRPQGDALKGLYGQVGGLGGLGQVYEQAALPYAQAGYNQIDPNNPVYANLQGLATGGQDYSQGMIDNLSQSLGQFYREQLLPGISSGAQMAGGLGGGRQGIAQGLAGGRVAQAFGQGVNDIMFQQQGNQINAANLYGNLMNQGIQSGVQNLGFQQNLALQPWSVLASILGTSPGTLNSGKSFNFGIGSAGG